MRNLTFVGTPLIAWIFACSLAHGGEWKRWPEKAGEFATTIAVPPGFTAIRAQRAALGARASDTPLLLTVRFRSTDRKVEFAVAVFHVRRAPADPAARRIAVTLARGEKIIDRQSSRRKTSGERGEYWLYDEEITVSGGGYTRYLRHSFSTGSLPGASSILWEFQAADEKARKSYAAAYRRFRDSLEIEED